MTKTRFEHPSSRYGVPYSDLPLLYQTYLERATRRGIKKPRTYEEFVAKYTAGYVMTNILQADAAKESK